MPILFCLNELIMTLKLTPQAVLYGSGFIFYLNKRQKSSSKWKLNTIKKISQWKKISQFCIPKYVRSIMINEFLEKTAENTRTINFE